MIAETVTRYRLSRAALVRLRAFRRILKTGRLAHVRFGGSDLRERSSVERRREERRMLQVPVYLRRVEVSGLTVHCDSSAEPLLAVTQNVSINGLGLIHDHPLSPGNWYLAEFDVFAERPLYLLVQARWMKADEPYSFRTGCRIAGVCRGV